MVLKRQDVELGLAELIRKQTHTRLELIEDLNLRGARGLDLDSVDILDLIGGIEEKYNLKVSDEDVQKLKTYGQVIDYIFDKKGNH